MSHHLSQLLAPWIRLPTQRDGVVGGLALHSGAVQVGDVYLACKGSEHDGRDFMVEAVSKGAMAVIAEARDGVEEGTIETIETAEGGTIAVIALSNLLARAGEMAATFYGHPSRQLQVIGITGTNGKTSTAHFLATSFEALGRRCAVVGTLGVGFLSDTLTPTHMTTPDPISLQKHLAHLRDKGAEIVVMEVSSHAIVQHRIAGIQFDCVVLTNVTRDHLDYHGDMQAYLAVKKQFLTRLDVRCRIVNAGDTVGLSWLRSCDRLDFFGYGIGEPNDVCEKGVWAETVVLSEHGFQAQLATPWGEACLTGALLGTFNIENVLAVLAVLGVYGLCHDEAHFKRTLHVLSQLKSPEGRMQAWGGGDCPLVIVDYAHTPDALQQVLITLRQHCKRRLWCVVGCGGERDQGKRSLMGKIAERYSDELILTDDNPRYEDPQSIIKAIMSALLCPWAVVVEHDRKCAIHYAIQSAEVGDIVLIAGKGHETNQLIAGQRIAFSDSEQVQLALRTPSSIATV